MKHKAPRFELTRVMESGEREPAQIVPVHRLPVTTMMNRRGFLGAGMSLSGTMGLVAACGSGSNEPTAPVVIIDSVRDTNLVRPNTNIAVKTRRCSPNTIAHRGAIDSIAYSADGKFLATSSSNGFEHTVKLWELPLRQLQTTSTTNEYISSELAFTADSTELIELSGAGTVYARSLPDLEASRILADNPLISQLMLHPNGDWFGTATNNAIEVRTIATGELVTSIGIPGVGSFVFSPDGTQLAVDAGRIQLWNLSNGEMIKQMPSTINDGRALTLRYSSDGDRVFAHYGGSSRIDSSYLRVWSVSGRSLLRSIFVGGALGGSSLMALSPDGKILASKRSVTLTLWDTVNYRHLASFEIDSSARGTGSLTFDSTGQWLANGASGSLTFLHIPSLDANGCLFDPELLYDTQSAIQYRSPDANGDTAIFGTTAVNTSLAPSATCTCNTVQGVLTPPPAPTPRPSRPPGSRYACTCNRVCTCVPVYF